MALELRILGPLEAASDGIPIDLGTTKERALLALLALNAGRVLSVDRLAEDLWEGEPPPQAAATLRVYVSHLRKALAGTANGEVIRTRRPGYVLELAPEAIDAWQFDSTCARARSARDAGDPAEAARLYREAIALWHGPALADVADHGFARTESLRLEEARLAALEGRIEADLDLGRDAEVTGELEALTTEHPLHERLWAHRITALYRAGRQADALAAYRELRDRLAEELGVDPSPALQELERQMLAHDPALAVVQKGSASAPRDLDLPVYRTTFLGREDEIASLARALDASQLVTLTGVGGCGKTRLAVEGAARVAGHFPGGVYFADLGTIGDPDVAPVAVATSLGMATGRLSGMSAGTIFDEISNRLRNQVALVLLDNCEHLLEASGEIAEALLRASAGVRVLATSREALGIEGERVLTVPSLGLPDDDDLFDADSVRLFTDRAVAARAGFGLAQDNVEAVAEICRRLDGIPLAIELAAARVTHLSPRQIADRLNDRFRLLTGGRRRIQRQQTLQAALDWSYDLLEPDERIVLRRLAVFPGDFSLEVAEAVAGFDVETLTLDVLGSLVSKSLLGTTDHASVVRYRLPETLRLYAEQRLAEAGESDVIRDKHLAFFLTWVNSLSDDIAFYPYAGLELEYLNVTEAIKWAELVGNVEALASILARTRLHWWVLGWWPEGSRLFELALEAEELERGDRVSLLVQYANLLFSQGDLERSIEFGRRGIELGRDEDGYRMVEALFRLASVLAASDRPAAEALLARAIPIAQHLGEVAVKSLGVQRAEAAMVWGDFEVARDLYDSSRDIPGRHYMAHWARFGRILALCLLDDDQEALEASDEAVAGVAASVLEESSARGGPITDSFLVLWTWIARALALTKVDRMADARSALGLVRDHVTRTRVHGGEALFLPYAAIAFRKGDYEPASRLLAKSAPGMTTLSSTAVYRHYARLVQQALGPERSRRCRAEGSALTDEEALRLAETF